MSPSSVPLRSMGETCAHQHGRRSRLDGRREWYREPTMAGARVRDRNNEEGGEINGALRGEDLHVTSRAPCEQQSDDLMSIYWTFNVRKKCHQLFKPTTSLSSSSSSSSASKSSSLSSSSKHQQSRAKSSARQQAKISRGRFVPAWPAASAQTALASTSQGSDTNNNCAQLAQWLAELAKIPPSTQDYFSSQDMNCHCTGHSGKRFARQASAADQLEHYPNEVATNTTQTTAFAGYASNESNQCSRERGESTSFLNEPDRTCRPATSCYYMASNCTSGLEQRSSKRFCDSQQADNLSALSASSSLLSQLLNSSLNQLIGIDNGSGTPSACSVNENDHQDETDDVDEEHDLNDLPGPRNGWQLRPQQQQQQNHQHHQQTSLSKSFFEMKPFTRNDYDDDDDDVRIGSYSREASEESNKLVGQHHERALVDERDLLIVQTSNHILPQQHHLNADKRSSICSTLVESDFERLRQQVLLQQRNRAYQEQRRQQAGRFREELSGPLSSVNCRPLIGKSNCAERIETTNGQYGVASGQSINRQVVTFDQDSHNDHLSRRLSSNDAVYRWRTHQPSTNISSNDTTTTTTNTKSNSIGSSHSSIFIDSSGEKPTNDDKRAQAQAKGETSSGWLTGGTSAKQWIAASEGERRLAEITVDESVARGNRQQRQPELKAKQELGLECCKICTNSVNDSCAAGTTEIATSPLLGGSQVLGECSHQNGELINGTIAGRGGARSTTNLLSSDTCGLGVSMSKVSGRFVSDAPRELTPGRLSQADSGLAADNLAKLQLLDNFANLNLSDRSDGSGGSGGSSSNENSVGNSSLELNFQPLQRRPFRCRCLTPELKFKSEIEEDQEVVNYRPACQQNQDNGGKNQSHAETSIDCRNQSSTACDLCNCTHSSGCCTEEESSAPLSNTSLSSSLLNVANNTSDQSRSSSSATKSSENSTSSSSSSTTSISSSSCEIRVTTTSDSSEDCFSGRSGGGGGSNDNDDRKPPKELTSLVALATSACASLNTDGHSPSRPKIDRLGQTTSHIDHLPEHRRRHHHTDEDTGRKSMGSTASKSSLSNSNDHNNCPNYYKGVQQQQQQSESGAACNADCDGRLSVNRIDLTSISKLKNVNNYKNSFWFGNKREQQKQQDQEQEQQKLKSFECISKIDSQVLLENNYTKQRQQQSKNLIEALYPQQQQAFIALPFRQPARGQQKQEEESSDSERGDNRLGRQLLRNSQHRQVEAAAIFSLDPRSQEAAERGSMVEATASLARVVISRDSSRPSSVASSSRQPSAVGRSNTPMALAGDDSLLLTAGALTSGQAGAAIEPIYDVPSLSLIDSSQPAETRCLSPDQKYPSKSSGARQQQQQRVRASGSISSSQLKSSQQQVKQQQQQQQQQKGDLIDDSSQHRIKSDKIRGVKLVSGNICLSGKLNDLIVSKSPAAHMGQFSPDSLNSLIAANNIDEANSKPWRQHQKSSQQHKSAKISHDCIQGDNNDDGYDNNNQPREPSKQSNEEDSSSTRQRQRHSSFLSRPKLAEERNLMKLNDCHKEQEESSAALGGPEKVSGLQRSETVSASFNRSSCSCSPGRDSDSICCSSSCQLASCTTTNCPTSSPASYLLSSIVYMHHYRGRHTKRLGQRQKRERRHDQLKITPKHNTMSCRRTRPTVPTTTTTLPRRGREKNLIMIKSGRRRRQLLLASASSCCSCCSCTSFTNSSESPGSLTQAYLRRHRCSASGHNRRRQRRRRRHHLQTSLGLKMTSGGGQSRRHMVVAPRSAHQMRKLRKQRATTGSQTGRHNVQRCDTTSNCSSCLCRIGARSHGGHAGCHRCCRLRDHANELNCLLQTGDGARVKSPVAATAAVGSIASEYGGEVATKLKHLPAKGKQDVRSDGDLDNNDRKDGEQRQQQQPVLPIKSLIKDKHAMASGRQQRKHIGLARFGTVASRLDGGELSELAEVDEEDEERGDGEETNDGNREWVGGKVASATIPALDNNVESDVPSVGGSPNKSNDTRRLDRSTCWRHHETCPHKRRHERRISSDELANSDNSRNYRRWLLCRCSSCLLRLDSVLSGRIAATGQRRKRMMSNLGKINRRRRRGHRYNEEDADVSESVPGLHLDQGFSTFATEAGRKAHRRYLIQQLARNLGQTNEGYPVAPLLETSRPRSGTNLGSRKNALTPQQRQQRQRRRRRRPISLVAIASSTTSCCGCNSLLSCATSTSTSTNHHYHHHHHRCCRSSSRASLRTSLSRGAHLATWAGGRHHQRRHHGRRGHIGARVTPLVKSLGAVGQPATVGHGSRYRSQEALITSTVNGELGTAETNVAGNTNLNIGGGVQRLLATNKQAARMKAKAAAASASDKQTQEGQHKTLLLPPTLADVNRHHHHLQRKQERQNMRHHHHHHRHHQHRHYRNGKFNDSVSKTKRTTGSADVNDYDYYHHHHQHQRRRRRRHLVNRYGEATNYNQRQQVHQQQQYNLFANTDNKPSLVKKFACQMSNQCQCEHCCLVGMLVKMDVEARRLRKLTTNDK